MNRTSALRLENRGSRIGDGIEDPGSGTGSRIQDRGRDRGSRIGDGIEDPGSEIEDPGSRVEHRDSGNPVMLTYLNS